MIWWNTHILAHVMFISTNKSIKLVTCDWLLYNSVSNLCCQLSDVYLSPHRWCDKLKINQSMGNKREGCSGLFQLVSQMFFSSSLRSGSPTSLHEESSENDARKSIHWESGWMFRLADTSESHEQAHLPWSNHHTPQEETFKTAATPLTFLSER